MCAQRVCVYLVWPSESFHTGSMATGLMAHSRMARAKANSLALLHIWTALIQLVLPNTRGAFHHLTSVFKRLKGPGWTPPLPPTCERPSWGA